MPLMTSRTAIEVVAVVARDGGSAELMYGIRPLDPKRAFEFGRIAEVGYSAIRMSHRGNRYAEHRGENQVPRTHRFSLH